MPGLDMRSWLEGCGMNWEATCSGATVRDDRWLHNESTRDSGRFVRIMFIWLSIFWVDFVC